MRSQRGLAIAVSGGFASLSAAAPVVFEINYEFSGATAPNGPAPWMTATFTQDPNDNDCVFLTMTLSNSFFADNPDAKIDEWNFNLNPDHITAVEDLDVEWVSGVVALGGVGLDEDGFKADGDGWYDIRFDFSSSGNNTWKDGSGLQSVYQICATSDLTPEDFRFLSLPGGGNGPFFTALHVQGLGDGGAGSGWLTMIPLPSAAGMSLAGLGMIGIRRHR